MGVRNRCCGVFWLILCAQLGACAAKDDGPPSLGFAPDGSYDVPPVTVVSDFPDAIEAPDGGWGPSIGVVPVTGGGTGGGGTTPTPGSDGGTTSDAATDTASTGPCDVLMQSCGTKRGCYPAAGGAGMCGPAGDLGANTTCAAHSDCAPGLICVEAYGAGSSTCQAACDPNSSEFCVGGGGTCKRISGLTIGFCQP